jgi:hypothetical protein
MATKVKTTAKKTGTKSAGNKATTNGRRTQEDIDKLVPQFVKSLKAGDTMRSLKAEHGFSDDGPIRQALARAGYDSKGQKLELPTVKATPAGVKAARNAGHAWYIIALATDKSEAEVKALAKKSGMDVTGRVRVGGGRGR